MINLIKKILSIKKIYILPPKKNKILFIGSHNVNLFEKYILNNNHTICEIHSINLFILIISFFRRYKNNTLINYYLNFIKYTKPKIVSTFVDNYVHFYILKNFFPSLIFISIQNGWRGEIGDLFEKKNIQKFDNLKSDYILTLNDSIGKKYSENIKHKTIKIGSFKSNLFKINKFTKKNTLAFISNYKKRSNEYFHYTKNSKIKFTDYFLSDKYIVKFLSKYCSENKIEFFIIPCSYGQDEYDYYLSDNQFKFSMLNKKNRYCSYEYINEFDHQVATESTLGYESLFRGNRVGFFNIRKYFISKYTQEKLDCHNFLWPGNLKMEGPFWTHKKDENSMKRVLDFIFRSSENEWKEALNTINKENFILYDNQNTILKNLFKKVLEENV